MGDVTVLAFAKDAVEHSGSTEQSNMATVQGREWSASRMPYLGQKYARCLPIGCRVQQQVFHFVQRNSRIGQNCRTGTWNFVLDRRATGQRRKFLVSGQAL